MVKPILFNTEMVRAILDGRKTETRRCVKYKYSNTEMKMRTDKYGTHLIEIQKDVEGETFGKNEDGKSRHKVLGYVEPKAPYQKGDILYVRETWNECCRNTIHSPIVHSHYCFKASADSPLYGCIDNECGQICKWRPSIHMTKKAARIWLKVTGVRVERLQDITEDHVVKEGVKAPHYRGYLSELYSVWCEKLKKYVENENPFYVFSQLWDSTIKKSDIDLYGWDVNPWVWVIEFERCDKQEEAG